MKRAVIENIIACLRKGQSPELDPEVFSSVEPDKLREIAAGLTAADIPVFERALRAIDERDLAWLGFKIVLDPAVAVTNVDNEVTKKFGDKGSANGSYVNGQVYVLGDVIDLKNNDVIVIGSTKFVFLAIPEF